MAFDDLSKKAEALKDQAVKEVGDVAESFWRKYRVHIGIFAAGVIACAIAFWVM